MNVPISSSATHSATILTGPTAPKSADWPAVSAPLNENVIKDLTTKQNLDLTNDTEMEQIPSPSDTIRIDIERYRPLPTYARALEETFQVVQRWEGFVLEVSKDTFTARLVPIQGEGGDQEADIYLREVHPDDRPLVKPGAIFYWSIGYLKLRTGRRKETVIRFRRLPPWTQRELTRTEEEERLFYSLFVDE